MCSGTILIGAANLSPVKKFGYGHRCSVAVQSQIEARKLSRYTGIQLRAGARFARRSEAKAGVRV